MRIERAKFLTSMASFQPLKEYWCPQIAMIGRSNVGKSSLINRLGRNKKLARVSSDPGKTRLINFYDINDGTFLLVDLPGYGFARASKAEKDRWGRMIEGYLSANPLLLLAVLLVDIRHQPTRDDIMMVEYLRHYEIPFLVAANKADKLSRAACGRSLPVIYRTLAVQPWQVVTLSAETGAGIDELLDRVEQAIATVSLESQAEM